MLRRARKREKCRSCTLLRTCHVRGGPRWREQVRLLAAGKEMHVSGSKTRTDLLTERVELLPCRDESHREPSPEQLAAFQKKFEIKDKELAEQLIYALEGDCAGSSDLEQLAKSISGAGREEHQLDVLFRLLDGERSGNISTSAVNQQLRKVRVFLPAECL